MCGWGAGGESGPGAGLAWGDVEARPGGIRSGGRVSGERTGRPGTVPVALGGGGGEERATATH